MSILSSLLTSLANTPRALYDAARRAAIPVLALTALVLSMGGTWRLGNDAHASPTATVKPADLPLARPAKKEVTGKLNLNTATEEQLMLLPSIGPAKAERIVAWRKKNGSFRRAADLRRVKGFGYKTFKRLAPYLDIKGETTLAPKR